MSDELMEMILKDTFSTNWRWMVNRPVKYKNLYFPLLAWAKDDDGTDYIATHVRSRIHISREERIKNNLSEFKEILKIKMKHGYSGIYSIVKEAITEEKVLLFQWLEEKK